MDEKKSKLKQYWQLNLRYIVTLLSIWFLSSFVISIILADELNKLEIFGFKLGFWFAQQGTMIIFVALIFIYVFLMNKLDQKFNVHED